MHFKRKATLSERQAARRDKLQDAPELSAPGFTLMLNTVLSRAMKAECYYPVARLWACVTRKSWGNWCEYAITEGVLEVDDPDHSIDSLAGIFFGLDVCPYCGRRSLPVRGLPPKWRWHVRCVQLAYAREAVRFGDEKQQEWGRAVILGTAPQVPIVREKGDTANA